MIKSALCVRLAALTEHRLSVLLAQQQRQAEQRRATGGSPNWVNAILPAGIYPERISLFKALPVQKDKEEAIILGGHGNGHYRLFARVGKIARK